MQVHVGGQTKPKMDVRWKLASPLGQSFKYIPAAILATWRMLTLTGFCDGQEAVCAGDELFWSGVPDVDRQNPPELPNDPEDTENCSGVGEGVVRGCIWTSELKAEYVALVPEFSLNSCRCFFFVILSKSGPSISSEIAPWTVPLVRSIFWVSNSTSICHSDAKPCRTNFNSTGLLLSFATERNKVTDWKLMQFYPFNSLPQAKFD